MATIEILGTEYEFRCTARTTTIYEHEFCNDPNPRVTGDIIADIMQRQKVTEGSGPFIFDDEGNLTGVVIDYTNDNWNAEKRALWAMIKTQAEIDIKHGAKRKRIPSYTDWDDSLIEWEPDMREVANSVGEELNRGLFRAGAAAS